MSKEYSITVYGQPSLIKPADRTFTIYFEEPESGVNEQTGILLFIAGYGGNASSNVYKKMRSQFADQYNLITLQCDYFGHEFMQEPDKDMNIPIECLQQHFAQEQIQALFHNYQENEHLLYGKTFPFPVIMDESPENYNDMGPVQAMDQLIALKIVSDILEQNHCVYNAHKIIAYGQSHGAYLAHLCNCYMRDIFSAIIDNSSYIRPYFLTHTRDYELQTPHFTIIKQIKYLASKLDNDLNLMDLSFLYTQFHNKANIIAFQGSDDNMTTYQNKYEWISAIPNSNFEYIDSSHVDNHIFHSTLHGMDADFLHLFSYVMEHYTMESQATSLQFKDNTIQTNHFTYHISMEDGIPIMYPEKIQ